MEQLLQQIFDSDRIIMEGQDNLDTSVAHPWAVDGDVLDEHARGESDVQPLLAASDFWEEILA